MKIRVDGSRCMAHGMCTAMAPDVYHVTDEGYNDQGEFIVSADKTESARRGANACPERIIEVDDG